MQKILVIGLLIIFFPAVLLPQENQTARCTGDRVNVRARPLQSGEIVTQLKADEEVEVIEKKDDWTEIMAPSHTNCWLNKDYVDNRVVKGGSVNLRSGPGVAFPVLCQVKTGTSVKVIETKGDWMRIEPPLEFGVWVSSNYLKYPEPVKEEEPVLVIPQPEVPDSISSLPEEVSGMELISYAGKLEDLGILINRPGTYKLVDNGRWRCILRSPELDINPYVNRIVRVDGVVVAESCSWNVPVVEVRKLQVIKSVIRNP